MSRLNLGSMFLEVQLKMDKFKEGLDAAKSQAESVVNKIQKDIKKLEKVLEELSVKPKKGTFGLDVKTFSEQIDKVTAKLNKGLLFDKFSKTKVFEKLAIPPETLPNLQRHLLAGNQNVLVDMLGVKGAKKAVKEFTEFMKKEFETASNEQKSVISSLTEKWDKKVAGGRISADKGGGGGGGLFRGFFSSGGDFFKSILQIGLIVKALNTLKRIAIDAPLASIQAFREWEYAMTLVKAKAGATNEEFERMKGLTRDIGRDSRYSATETANALKVLIEMGLQVSESMEMLPGLLKFAAVEEIDLAHAADIALGVIRGMNMQTSEFARVSDVVAYTSAKSAASVFSVGQAFKVSASAAAASGQTLEDVAAVVGGLSNRMIRAENAGHAITQMIARLTRVSQGGVVAIDETGSSLQKARQAIIELGVNALDATTGKLRPLLDIFEELKSKGATTGQILQIFGVYTYKYALAAMGATEESRELLDALKGVNNAAKGATDKMSSEVLNTLDTKIKKLSNAFGALKITIGEALDRKVVRGFVETLTEAIQHIDKAFTNTIQKVEILPEVKEFVMNNSMDKVIEMFEKFDKESKKFEESIGGVNSYTELFFGQLSQKENSTEIIENYAKLTEQVNLLKQQLLSASGVAKVVAEETKESVKEFAKIQNFSTEPFAPVDVPLTYKVPTTAFKDLFISKFNIPQEKLPATLPQDLKELEAEYDKTIKSMGSKLKYFSDEEYRITIQALEHEVRAMSDAGKAWINASANNAKQVARDSGASNDAIVAIEKDKTEKLLGFDKMLSEFRTEFYLEEIERVSKNKVSTLGQLEELKEKLRELRDEAAIKIKENAGNVSPKDVEEQLNRLNKGVDILSEKSVDEYYDNLDELYRKTDDVYNQMEDLSRRYYYGEEELAEEVYRYKKEQLDLWYEKNKETLEDSLILQKVYAAKLEELERKRAENSGDFHQGLSDGFQKFSDDAMNTYQIGIDGAMLSLNTSANSFVEIMRDLRNGELKSWKDYAMGWVGIMLDALNEILIKMLLVKLIGAAINMWSTPSSTSSSSMSAGGWGMAHEGGLIMHKGGTVPRFNKNFLSHDEVPAVLKQGEFVIKDSVVSKYGEGLFNALNNDKVPVLNDFNIPDITNNKLKGVEDIKGISMGFDIPNIVNTRLNAIKDVDVPKDLVKGLSDRVSRSDNINIPMRENSSGGGEGETVTVNNTFNFNTSAIDESSVDVFFKKNAPRIQNIVGEGVERSMAFAKRIRGRGENK